MSPKCIRLCSLFTNLKYVVKIFFGLELANCVRESEASGRNDFFFRAWAIHVLIRVANNFECCLLVNIVLITLNYGFAIGHKPFRVENRFSSKILLKPGRNNLAIE